MLCRFKAFRLALLLLLLATCVVERQEGRRHHQPPVAFQVSIPVRAEPRREGAGAPRPLPSPEVTSQTPRVRGVFIGISDYQGVDHDLQYCDTDAARLAQDFRDNGLTAANNDVVSLVNQRATYIAVFAAFRALAARTREQDLFVFFFDGHGSRREIELYDQVIVADDVRSLLAQIPRGRKLILLDSCEAGGFASVVAGSLRTAGLFAAGENEEAQTAPELGAGGYLAYYVRQELWLRRPSTGQELFRTVQAGYAAHHLQDQHVVLAGNGAMLLW